MTSRLVVLLCLFLASASAQSNRPFPMPGIAWRVRVHVVFTGMGACDASTHVVLTSETGNIVGDGRTDGECLVEFPNVRPGNYRATVVGRDIRNTETADVEVNSSDMQDVEVRVRRIGEPESAALPVNALISAADLSIPSGAAKEFDRANRLIGKQEWAKAVERLRKAVAIYPDYPAAYNNLGVVYTYLGNRTEGREALQKAITLNDRLAPAYVNLSRISIAGNDFSEAEALLGKAASLAPSDAITFVLLAYVQARNQHLDQVVATGRQAHALTQGQHAFVHLAAAHAFEQIGRIPDAIAELQLFLAEDKTSPQEQEVRKALATLQASLQ